MKLVRWLAAIAALVPIAAATPAACAETDPYAEGASPWSYLFAPYFLMPNLSGTTGIGGTDVTVDASPTDIFDNLQASFTAYFEAHTPEWAIGLDYLYMDLGDSGTIPSGSVDVNLEQTQISGLGMRRVAPWAEAVAGLQWNSIDAGLKGTGGATIDRRLTESWVDPVIGARVGTMWGEKWKGSLLVLAGGFGVGSDFCWQVNPLVSYRFSPVISVGVAYRAIGTDYTNGSGADEFHLDVTTFGPAFGVGFHF